MKTFFLLFFLLLFTGCESKLVNILQKDPEYVNTLRYTKRGHLTNSLETKALFNSTYLNPLNKEFTDGEYFLIGIYIEDEPLRGEFTGIYNKEYSLTLNKQTFISAETMEKEDKMISRYPFYNRWMRYYIVKFKTLSGEKKQLLFEHKTFGKVTHSYK